MIRLPIYANDGEISVEPAEDGFVGLTIGLEDGDTFDTLAAKATDHVAVFLEQYPSTRVEASISEVDRIFYAVADEVRRLRYIVEHAHEYVTRNLTPAEARALSSMLLHFAAETER